MKLIIVIMTTFLMQVSAATYAQQITLREGSISLKKVFTEIRRQTGYTVLYRSDVINNTKPVNLDLNKVPLEDALKEILKGQNLDYVIKDKAIFVSKKEPSFLENIIARFQAIDVRGTVINESGFGLAGATIKVVGGATTKSDKDGAFFLQDVDENATVVISYIGYKDIEVRPKKVLTIQMELVSSQLQEVTINKGYYRTRKELETGNVSTVTSKEIGQQPVSNPLAAMVGRLSGVQVSQTNGLPGGGFSVQIRGKNSLRNGSDPLYVVDGVPYPLQLQQSATSILLANSLSFINPSNIESIDVLKDADATAIYGSRGANGVVLITTKKGKSGQMNIDLNVYAGLGKMPNRVKLLNTQQYLDVRNETFKNDGITASADPGDITGGFAPDLKVWDTSRYTDWQEVLLGNTARYTSVQGNITGGNANVQYLLGGNYFKETTVLLGDGANQKGNLNFNFNGNSSDYKFKVQFSGAYQTDGNNLINSDFVAIALTTPPDAPELNNSDGTLNWASINPGDFGTWSNPLATLERKYKSHTSNLIANSLVSYSILPGLELKSSFGYNNLQVEETAISPLTSYDPAAAAYVTGSAEYNSANTNSWIIEPQLNYHTNIGPGSLTVLIGTSFQQQNNTGQRFSATGFSSDAFLENIHAASTVTLGNTTLSKYKYNAIFGRLNYNLKDKYLINLTARRDGSSRFGPDKQFGNFAAIGAAWIFSNEKFIAESIPIISYGKLRGSFGTTGSDQIPNYEFLDSYSLTTYGYGGVKGLIPSKLFNPVLAWELSKKLEVGLDLGFLNDHISIGMSYFRSRSSNQLLRYLLSNVTGFNNININLPATNENSGFEFVLNTINIKTDNFKWSSTFNLTLPKNKLHAFPGLDVSSYTNAYVVGLPTTIQKRFHYLGIDPQTGQFQFEGADGNPTFDPVDPKDKTVIIDPFDKYYYGGLQNSFQFKRFSLDFLFQFVHRPNGIPYSYKVFPGAAVNQPIAVLDHWKTPGDRSAFPQYSQDYGRAIPSSYDYYINSDGYLADQSFIRLKNLAFSYNIPTNLLSKLHVKSLRVYLQGQNLLTFTKYKGLDPETGPDRLPPIQVFTTGFQLTL